MPDLPDPVVLTEAELLAAFAGGQPEQLAMRNLIHTLFSVVTGGEVNGSFVNLTVTGTFTAPNLPIADPLADGEVWLNTDVLTMSAGAP